MFSEMDLIEHCGSRAGPNVMDLWEVDFDHDEPKCHHPEDHILAPSRWQYNGHLPESTLFTFEDRHPSELLERCAEHNDVISIEDLRKEPISQSLFLLRLRPEHNALLSYSQQSETKLFRPRFSFNLNSKEYDLSVTDPNYPKTNDRPSDKSIDRGYVALGLTDPFNERRGVERYHYKIALTLFI